MDNRYGFEIHQGYGVVVRAFCPIKRHLYQMQWPTVPGMANSAGWAPRDWRGDHNVSVAFHGLWYDARCRVAFSGQNQLKGHLA